MSLRYEPPTAGITRSGGQVPDVISRLARRVDGHARPLALPPAQPLPERALAALPRPSLHFAPGPPPPASDF